MSTFKSLPIATFWSGQLPITTITRRMFLIHASLMIAGAVLLGPNAFMSLWTVCLVVVLDLVCYTSLRWPSDKSRDLLLTSAWFTLLFFLPRLAAMFLFPASTTTFVALEPFRPDEIDRGLYFLIGGYVALWAGCWVGGVFASRAGSARPMVGRQLPLLGISVYAALTLVAGLFVSYALNISVYAPDPTRWGSPLGWLTRVLDTDAALVLIITWAFLNPKRSIAQNIAVYGAILIWLAFITLQGSRGGPLRIMILVGLVAFVTRGDFLISMRKIIAILLVTAVASVAMAVPASLIRFLPGSGDAALTNLVDQLTRAGPVSDDLQSIWPSRRAWVTSPVVEKAARSISPIITRLGLLDYAITIVARDPNQPVIDKYLRSSYAFKNFANNLVPGELFPGYDIMTSRVFTMAYRGATEEHIRTSFLSEPWTLWGFGWLMGRGAIGGLLVILALSAATQGVYHLVTRSLGLTYRPYVAVAFLFLSAASGLLQLFGIDHWLTINVHFALALLTAFLITQGIAMVLGRSRRPHRAVETTPQDAQYTDAPISTGPTAPHS